MPRSGYIYGATLATPDPAASTQFYEHVLGRFVGDTTEVDGAGPGWRLDAAVRSVRLASRRVLRHGGRILAAPSTFADPWGAVFILSKPPKAYRPGPRWAMLSTPEPEAATRFYDAALHWDLPGAGVGLPRRRGRQRPNAAVNVNFTPPPRWTVSLHVEDAAAATRRAIEAHATLTKEGPFWADLADPLGHEFGVIEDEPAWLYP